MSSPGTVKRGHPRLPQHPGDWLVLAPASTHRQELQPYPNATCPLLGAWGQRSPFPGWEHAPSPGEPPPTPPKGLCWVWKDLRHSCCKDQLCRGSCGRGAGSRQCQGRGHPLGVRFKWGPRTH